MTELALFCGVLCLWCVVLLVRANDGPWRWFRHREFSDYSRALAEESRRLFLQDEMRRELEAESREYQRRHQLDAALTTKLEPIRRPGIVVPIRKRGPHARTH